jgi:hypothetical protein
MNWTECFKPGDRCRVRHQGNWKTATIEKVIDNTAVICSIQIGGSVSNVRCGDSRNVRLPASPALARRGLGQEVAQASMFSGER